MLDAFRIFEAGGFVMYPLLFISLAAVAFSVERFLAFRQFGSNTPGLTDEIVDMVRNGRAGDALRRAEEVPGPVAAAAASVLRYRTAHIEDIKREVGVTLEDYFVRLERFLPWLDTFTTLSPLLGLLGTILGMVKVFQDFKSASAEGGSGATDSLLAGVGESLYATAFGIAIAVFCFFCYNYFAATRRSVAIEAQQTATRLTTLVHELQRRQGNAPDEIIATGKRRERKKPGMKQTKVEIIPMIDTMFFLLVFFILTSVGAIKPTGKVTLPDAATSDRKKPASVTIAILSETERNKPAPVGGNWAVVNSVSVKVGESLLPTLEAEVEKSVGPKPAGYDANPGDASFKDYNDLLTKSTITVQADKAVHAEDVVKTMEEIAKVGIPNLTIATGGAGGGGSSQGSSGAASGTP